MLFIHKQADDGIYQQKRGRFKFTLHDFITKHCCMPAAGLITKTLLLLHKIIYMLTASALNKLYHIRSISVYYISNMLHAEAVYTANIRASIYSLREMPKHLQMTYASSSR
jgi:hypothetical protein